MCGFGGRLLTTHYGAAYVGVDVCGTMMLQDELVNGTGPGAPPADDGAGSSADADNTDSAERARRYFNARASRSEAAAGPNADAVRERRRRRAAAEGAPADGDGEDADDDLPPERRPLLVLTAGQLEDGELRFRRLHAAAVVAGAAADAATPLLMSANLAAAVSAAEVLRAALAALGAATPCVEAEAAVLEEYGGLEGRMRPVRPETPKVGVGWVCVFEIRFRAPDDLRAEG